ncbi:MAG TPA: hypothetical protein VL563_13705 [Gemmatimonadales bacterium]|nr:hypothetical protein [Gemmatimonadales bacterium]
MRRSVPTVAAAPPEQESVPVRGQVPCTVTERARVAAPAEAVEAAEAAEGPGAQRRG